MLPSDHLVSYCELICSGRRVALISPLQERVIAAVPFLAAALFYLVSPLLSDLVERHMKEVLRKGSEGGTEDLTKVLPGRSDEYISRYVVYGIDAGAVVPACMLPVIGSIVVIYRGMSSIGVIIIVLLGFLFPIGISYWMLTRDPIKYLGNARTKYTALARWGLAVNLIAAGLVAYFVQP